MRDKCLAFENTLGEDYSAMHLHVIQHLRNLAVLTMQFIPEPPDVRLLSTAFSHATISSIWSASLLTIRALSLQIPEFASQSQHSTHVLACD